MRLTMWHQLMLLINRLGKKLCSVCAGSLIELHCWLLLLWPLKLTLLVVKPWETLWCWLEEQDSAYILVLVFGRKQAVNERVIIPHEAGRTSCEVLAWKTLASSLTSCLTSGKHLWNAHSQKSHVCSSHFIWNESKCVRLKLLCSSDFLMTIHYNLYICATIDQWSIATQQQSGTHGRTCRSQSGFLSWSWGTLGLSLCPPRSRCPRGWWRTPPPHWA